MHLQAGFNTLPVWNNCINNKNLDVHHLTIEDNPWVLDKPCLVMIEALLKKKKT